jgi:hypothetical protein
MDLPTHQFSQTKMKEQPKEPEPTNKITEDENLTDPEKPQKPKPKELEEIKAQHNFNLLFGRV